MELVATPEFAGRRLDVWLVSQMPDQSRSRIQRLLAQGHITIDGRAAKANTKVVAGMTAKVEIPPATPILLEPEDIPLDIVYEDPDLIVINKPPDLVVHPAAGHSSGTLVNAILHHCPDIKGIGGELRPGIVHRLDKDTSGALVIAKNDAAMTSLGAQFRHRQVRKEYLAIIHGCPERTEQRVETLIGRSSENRKKMSASPSGRGRPAVTHLHLEQRLGNFSLVRLRIETGRTHQIRVHMSYIGHPVAGDKQYGGRRERSEPEGLFPRQMLHAASLAFTHPTSGKPVAFSAPLPEDFKAAMNALNVQR